MTTTSLGTTDREEMAEGYGGEYIDDFDENGDARNVSFIYDRINSTSGEVESKTLTVPLLTIIPIPYVRVCLLF
mgnify:CR=1 FL=1